MLKKTFVSIMTAGVTLLSSISVSAYDMNMYVNNQFVVRDIQNIGGFDMLPILDIAGELGFQCYYDGNTINLYNDQKGYTFNMGSASVCDESGNWYGLDVVPQIINGKVRIPAKFFQDVMGTSYVWDEQTNTIFFNSESTYNWLTNTEEYKLANKKYMSNLYYNSLINMGSIVTYGDSMVGNVRNRYECDELWYYVADVNYDGVLDLVVSAEDYISNGIMIYTYSNGKIIRSYTEGFPYSAGVSRLTLAEYKGRYGVFIHRYNSSDDFDFGYIYGNWTIGLDTYGWHLDEWIINGSNVGKSSWENTFNSIKPVGFYNIWTLKSMGE